MVSPCSFQTCFIPGLVKARQAFWSEITSDQFILDTVSHGLRIPFLDSPNCAPSMRLPMSLVQKETLSTEINALLQQGIIVHREYELGDCVSPVFTTSISDGSHHFILNLKRFNLCVQHIHFKMEGLSDGLNMMRPGIWMPSVNLRDAYYSIPVHKEDQKFFSFAWEEKYYQFICLPNGYKDGPRVFIKVLKAPFAYLRRQGHASVIYLDDGYLQASTYEECCRNIQCTTSLLKALGFFISEKSVLTPTTRSIFLGFILDSDAMTITLTEKRKGKILSASKVMASAPTQRIRAVAALIIAALPGVKHGQLHYRRLERDKNIALLQMKGNFNKNMTLSAAAVQDIIWWYTNIPVSYSFIHPPLISHYLYTDASLAGWGATDTQLTAGGVWEEEEVPPAHINVLELRAAYLALQSLCKHCVDSHVCLYMDNSTAVVYINKKGGTHSVLCDALAVKIWQWAIPRNIWLSAVFIPGESNVVADFYSRCPNDNTEWQLDPVVFKKL